jgi:hypothetical protein
MIEKWLQWFEWQHGFGWRFYSICDQIHLGQMSERFEILGNTIMDEEIETSCEEAKWRYLTN